MNEETSSKPPKLFYWVSSLALVWNLIGIVSYLGQVMMTPESLAAMPAEQRVLYEDVPAWATSAYAIAVNAGALGCLLLLFRKSWAFPILVLSLVGILVQMGHAFLMTELLRVAGASSAILPAIIVVIGAYLVWFANDAKKKGWIG